MKIRACVIAFLCFMLFVSAGIDKKSIITGYRCGDFAPSKTLGRYCSLSLSNSSGRYTLLQFWAAYDVKSRISNIRMNNRISYIDNEQIEMISINLDKYESVFQETVQTDNLIKSNLFHISLADQPEIIRQYNLRKGLSNYLIDPYGVIVAVNITPEKILDYTKEAAI